REFRRVLFRSEIYKCQHILHSGRPFSEHQLRGGLHAEINSRNPTTSSGPSSTLACSFRFYHRIPYISDPHSHTSAVTLKHTPNNPHTHTHTHTHTHLLSHTHTHSPSLRGIASLIAFEK